MKKLTLVLMAVTLGVLLTMPAFAAGPGGCPGNGPGGDTGYHRDKIFKKLNLTDEQKTKIEALMSGNQKAIRPLREKMFDKSVELRRLWLQANPDKDKITAARDDAANKVSQRKRIGIKSPLLDGSFVPMWIPSTGYILSTQSR